MPIFFDDRYYYFEFSDFAWWTIVGILAGLTANLITARDGSPLIDMIAGVVGAFIGGVILGIAGLHGVGAIGNIISALVGAAVLLTIVNLLSRVMRRKQA